ncbi:hypothetical protein GF361_00950 [Candidatus Woesearchaeota archaeon]|nr:hypothetical protein [Candidatus Woesearchaeota archaeon]
MIPKREIRRKVFHILCGIIFVVLIYFDIINAFVMAVSVLAGLLLSFIYKKIRIPFLHKILVLMDRPRDIKTFPGKGAILYGIGALLVLLFFEKDIAMASIMILALGDSIAPLIGQYGQIRHPLDKKKFLEGSLAGAVAGFLGAWLFVAWYQALIAAAAAMISEGITLKIGSNQLDDNIIMPLVAGVILWLVRVLV